MKKLQTIILILFFLPLFSFSQDYWEQLYFPDTADIICLAVNNANDLFVGTGSNNTISGLYRSTDGAQSWDLLFNNSDFGVYSLCINQAGTIYLTKGGLINILTSTNNGDTWDTINKPSYINANINNIIATGIDTLFISSGMTSTPILFRSYDNGITWDSVFTTYNGTSEQISDIILNPISKVIYISLYGYFKNMGGVFKSEDGGDTWEFIGLFNYQVSSLALNSNGDLFAGSRGGMADDAWQGLYVLRNGNNDWDPLIYQPVIHDVIINSEDDIYCSTEWPNGVILSTDNGVTFELINEGLNSGAKEDMAIDGSGFIYVTSLYPSNFLAKTIETTVDIEENHLKPDFPRFVVYPNPCSDLFYLQDNQTIQRGSQIEEFRIRNMVSNRVIEYDISNYGEGDKIDVRALTPGLYCIEITLHSGEREAVKFIKY